MERIRFTTERVARIKTSTEGGEKHRFFNAPFIQQHVIVAESKVGHARAKQSVKRPLPNFFLPPSPQIEHPEDHPSYPIWKRLLVGLMDIGLLASAVILVSPIPLGWALVPLSISGLSVLVGKEHATQHLKKHVEMLWYGALMDYAAYLFYLATDLMKGGLAFAWAFVTGKNDNDRKKV